jgi:hypothetical protein
MPRGGSNKKSTLEHLKNNTYRKDRHGEIFSKDLDILNDMKKTIYNEFNKAKRNLNKETSLDELQKSKEDLIDYAKIYHILSTKIPPRIIEKEPDPETLIGNLINKKEM